MELEAAKKLLEEKMQEDMKSCADEVKVILDKYKCELGSSVFLKYLGVK